MRALALRRPDGLGARLAGAFSVVPIAFASWEAWHDHGSIQAARAHGFLPYAIVSALLLVTVLAAGAGGTPARPAQIAVLALSGLAIWATISLSWSPVPSLARDEGLLTAFYAIVLALPLVTLRTAESRITGLVAAVGTLAVFVVAVCIRVGFAGDVSTVFSGGRLAFPISYINAQGSLLALGFWPAVALSSRRNGGTAGRALSLGAACLFLTAATLVQSKGTMLGLAVATIVVLACSPQRVRLLVPLGVSILIEIALFGRLTDPYRDQSRAVVHTAGRLPLVAAVVGAALGVGWTMLDRRVHVEGRPRLVVGRALGALAAAAVLAGVGTFFAVEHHPVAFLDAKVQSFKHLSQTSTSTHLTSLGSNRYDFWRVALDEFAAHPLNGCGARCFGPAYLIHGRSVETPIRAHSLPIEVLAEQGIVGFCLLAAALGTAFAVLIRRARRAYVPALAGLGAGICWLVQASVDWTWTFPTVTVPALVLVGLGLATTTAGRPLRTRTRVPAATVCAAVAVLAFLPPWLSARLTQLALEGRTTNPVAVLRRARRLDPVSTAPLIAQAELASTRDAELSALRTAARMEPRVLATQYYLGVVLLNTGQRAAARAQLERTLRLDPGNETVLEALALAGAKSAR